MKKTITIIALLLLTACLAGAWTNASKDSAPTKVTVVGSTALQPLVETVAEKYQSSHSDVNILVQGGGSGTGLSQVQAGAVDVGNADVFANQQTGIDAAKLQDHIVAVSGIVPVVNPRLGINNLTLDQLRQIFTGKIKNWREVGGPDLPITVINRASGSGTRLAFEQTVLPKGSRPLNAQEQDSNGTVKEIVANNPGAISYIAFAYVNNQVKPLRLDGVLPTAKNVTINQWPLWSYEHMYTRGADQQATALIKYLQSEPVQSKIVKQARYISIHDMKVKKSPSGKVSEQK